MLAANASAEIVFSAHAFAPTRFRFTALPHIGVVQIV
jgi:hypothetical protein